MHIVTFTSKHVRFFLIFHAHDTNKTWSNKSLLPGFAESSIHLHKHISLPPDLAENAIQIRKHRSFAVTDTITLNSPGLLTYYAYTNTQEYANYTYTQVYIHNVCMYAHKHTHIRIHIYIEREREREEKQNHFSCRSIHRTSTYTYTLAQKCMYMRICTHIHLTSAGMKRHPPHMHTCISTHTYVYAEICPRQASLPYRTKHLLPCMDSNLCKFFCTQSNASVCVFFCRTLKAKLLTMADKCMYARPSVYLCIKVIWMLSCCHDVKWYNDLRKVAWLHVCVCVYVCSCNIKLKSIFPSSNMHVYMCVNDVSLWHCNFLLCHVYVHACIMHTNIHTHMHVCINFAKKTYDVHVIHTMCTYTHTHTTTLKMSCTQTNLRADVYMCFIIFTYKQTCILICLTIYFCQEPIQQQSDLSGS